MCENSFNELGLISSHRLHMAGFFVTAHQMTDKVISELEGIDEKAFAALSLIEMMEILTRRLMR